MRTRRGLPPPVPPKVCGSEHTAERLAESGCEPEAELGRAVQRLGGPLRAAQHGRCPGAGLGTPFLPQPLQVPPSALVPEARPQGSAGDVDGCGVAFKPKRKEGVAVALDLGSIRPSRHIAVDRSLRLAFFFVGAL